MDDLNVEGGQLCMQEQPLESLQNPMIVEPTMLL